MTFYWAKRVNLSVPRPELRFDYYAHIIISVKTNQIGSSPVLLGDLGFESFDRSDLCTVFFQHICRGAPG